MRFHAVNLPHTETTLNGHAYCAYTGKVRRFADMMTSLGHEVYLYGGEANDADCVENVVCITRSEQAEHFDGIPPFDAEHPGWKLFNGRAAAAVKDRAVDGDFLCLIGGIAQASIAKANPTLRTVEYGVGYEGVFSDFRVFESYAWMHTVYGHLYSAYGADGRFYDAVIPNYFDLAEFPQGKGDGDYLFFIGRLIDRKGLAVVRDVADRTGLPLVVAGEGDRGLVPAGAEYVGAVEPAKRAELMGAARATLVPTLYVEPFGGVSVESMLCGTPAITTDWGAFTESVVQGRTGYRCRTLAQFADAVEKSASLDRDDIRNIAQSRYSTNVVRHQYDAYFNQLAQLQGAGWYS